MDNLENTLRVNKFARRIRHSKVFSKKNLFKMNAGQLLSVILKPIKALGKTSVFTKIRRFLIAAKMTISNVLPIVPQKRLLFQSGIIATAAIIATSFTPGATLTAASLGYSNDYIAAYSLPGDVLVADEDGYLVKINPQTNESNRIGLTDYASHTVESGESLSVIAEKYGVAVNTIKWENNIYNANSLRSGQTLLVPPVDGISHKVAGSDSLDKIAKKYKISTDSIIAQNSLDSAVIYKGQNLFLPGAEPIQPLIASVPRSVGVGRGDSRALAGANANTAAPALGKIFIYPTRGKVTQGYRGGHYALDIADRSKPPIWSAAGGKVVKASSGTWGGGYGNHIIIDHGNGVKTLYAHLSTLNVYKDQWVDQGAVIGIMGNTGRVYGATGIHLHWEVIVNGVKQNPYNYF